MCGTTLAISPLSSRIALFVASLTALGRDKIAAQIAAPAATNEPTSEVVAMIVTSVILTILLLADYIVCRSLNYRDNDRRCGMFESHSVVEVYPSVNHPRGKTARRCNFWPEFWQDLTSRTASQTKRF